jgi:hypothetical protein
MDQLTNTQIYMDNLEQMIKDLSLDEETTNELLEQAAEENGEDRRIRVKGNPQPKKKRKLNEQGDYVVTKSRALLKRKCNKNRSQHQENTVVPSMLARNY